MSPNDSMPGPARPEVFAIDEIARAAGVTASEVRGALDEHDAAALETRYVGMDDALRVVRHLTAVRIGKARPKRLFAPLHGSETRRAMPLAASGALHAGALAVMVLVGGLSVRSAATQAAIEEPARLVFLMSPGPGGGGGGGGTKDRQPAPRAGMRGTSALQSPVSIGRRTGKPDPPETAEPLPSLVTPDPVPEVVSPPPVAAPPTPPVIAPVVTAPSDDADRTGVTSPAPASMPSHGSGAGGGTGTGQGTGSGQGDGAGIGDGSTAGIGGGPYRAGAGITPPDLVREVKPIYSEEGRRRGVEGEVVLEVVVRSDGNVGAVRIIKGLGAGLDARAADAVKQWRFTPARRRGTPVDVLVEVAVEFKLR